MSQLHVIFRVGKGEYVLAADDIVQMESFSGAVQVPGTAPYVAGIVQVRGRVIPVVNMRMRFGLPPVESTLDTRIVVVKKGDREVGLIVDSAREVVRLETDQFRPPPEMVSDQAQGFVDAVAQTGQRVLMRIDASRVIGRGELPQENEDGALETTAS